jgi:hypothetical protein
LATQIDPNAKVTPFGPKPTGTLRAIPGGSDGDGAAPFPDPDDADGVAAVVVGPAVC